MDWLFLRDTALATWDRMLRAPRLSTLILIAVALALYGWALRDRALYNVDGPAEGRYWSVAQYQFALATLRKHVYERALVTEELERRSSDALVARWKSILDTKLEVLSNAHEHKAFFERLDEYRNTMPLLAALHRDLPQLLAAARDSHDQLMQLKARFDEVERSLTSLASNVRLRDLDDLTDSLHQYQRGMRMQYWGAVAIVLALWVLLVNTAANARQARLALYAVTRAGIETQQTLQARTALIGILPHELRTPLQALLAATELIELSDTDGRLRASVGRLYAAISTIDRHVTDLARYADLTRGGVTATVPLAVRSLLGQIVAEHAEAAKVKGLSLDLQVDEEVPPTLPIDAVRVGQIANNLIANAIKYTTTGSVRTAATMRKEANGSSFVLSVQDTGPGIAKNEQSHVWEPFYRGEDAKNHPGTGLGLTVVRLASRSLGGEVELHSVPGKGARFTLVVPCSDAGAKRPSA